MEAIFRAALIALALSQAGAAAAQSVGIAATVNDEAISAIDVEARVALDAQNNPGAPQDVLRARALDELIEETLKLQEAKRLDVAAPPEQVAGAIANIAEQNGLTPDELRARLGPLATSLERRIEAQIAWVSVVNRQFGAESAVTEEEVDAAEATVDESFVSVSRDARLRLMQIFAPTPAGADRDALQAARSRVEEGRAMAAGCDDLARVHATLGLEDLSDLGTLFLSELPPDVADVVERLPIGRPSRALRLQTGYSVLYVCDRDFVSQEAVNRDALEGRLREQKLAARADRRLRDLKRLAIIERR